MNAVLERLGNAIEQRLHGPAYSGFLRRFGIDPKRYWLLMDLFHKLSSREERQDQLGRQTHSLRVSAGWFFVLTGLLAVGSIVVQAPAFVVAGLALGLTALSLFLVLLSEAANSLVNPEEALALSHYPINGATYTAAKLSHLLRVVGYYALGWNLFPGLVSPFLPNGRLFYAPLQLLAALILGVLLALFCCSVYGIVMRIVPARRLKSASYFVQAIPFTILGLIQFAPRGTLRRMLGPATFVIPLIAAHPLAAISGSAAIAVAVTIVGLRSLSADYLIRAASIVHGRSDAKTSTKRSVLGVVVRRLFGGQAGRAGFDYMRRMMARDWQFRRGLLAVLPLPFFIIIGIFGGGVLSPYGTSFSAAHFAPHALGYLTYMLCLSIPYGTDFKGLWLFLLISDGALARFARGVHASLWLMLIVIPTALMLPFFAWRWGIPEALSFLLFALPVSSIYLAFSLRKIDGVPFGKQLGARQTEGKIGVFAIPVVAIVAAGIQYLLFRSAAAVAIATVMLALAALFLTRWSLRSFEAVVHHHLGMASRTSTMIYREVGSDDGEIKLAI